MIKALSLAALMLTACAGTQATTRPAAHGAEAWRMAVKPNFARLSGDAPRATHAAVAVHTAPEAWQLAGRPNAARLAAPTDSARDGSSTALANVSRVNKALPW